MLIIMYNNNNNNLFRTHSIWTWMVYENMYCQLLTCISRGNIDILSMFSASSMLRRTTASVIKNAETALIMPFRRFWSLWNCRAANCLSDAVRVPVPVHIHQGLPNRGRGGIRRLHQFCVRWNQFPSEKDTIMHVSYLLVRERSA